MIIAHISDLHFGPQHRKESFAQAVKEINKLKPDAIVITGDLTENGLLREYKSAKQGIVKFDCKIKVALSGNHDYRSTGYLLFKQFFPSKQITEFDDVVIIPIGTARPDRDDGEAGHRQVLWLEETLSKYRNKFKIVALHHHLIPVPDTGKDSIPIIDAGDVLRALLKGGVDLVMCGHRHRPWMWNIEDFTVIHAGTLSSERMRGFFSNCYNIVEIKKRSIKTYLKVVGGEKLELSRIVKEAPLGIPEEY
ncbi:MAG: metallophosphoesterase [Thaumarchaeota archaeon]|nr:metallophosphoesterase [Nitrososphaerota archaeon]